MKKERIQKIIATSGVCSRRKAEELIKKSRVKCNSKVVKLGDKATFKDVIYIDDRPISLNKRKNIYIMLNKPKGYVTTTKDEKGRKTVLCLIEHEIKERVYPVGRLDYNSQGLLLLTNDGDFANLIMQPKNHIEKQYLVEIKKQIKLEDVEKLRNGVMINGIKTKKAKVKVLKSTQNLSEILITIHEGRNKQIRKMFKAVLNCEVKKLKRISIGSLTLSNLSCGKFKYLSLKDIEKLKNMACSKKD